MKNAKRFFVLTVVLTLLILSAPAVLVYVVDPFQVYHKLWVQKGAAFDATDRYQNAGLINSWLADKDQKISSVIIGSSMSQNFPIELMKNLSGVPALRLTLSGGSAKELHYIAEKAIQTGNVKGVLWEIHAPYVLPDPEAMHHESPLPLFLYDGNIINDWRYLYNNDVVEESIALLKGKLGRRAPLIDLYTWENKAQFEAWTSKDNMKVHRESLKKADLPISKQPPENIRSMTFPNVEQHLLPVLKAHPDIKFSLYFPPISYYGLAVKGNEAFWTNMMMRKAVLEGIRGLPNVNVYSFDLDKGIGDTITLYQDVEHYRPAINALMIQRMTQCKNMSLPDNWQKDTDNLVKKVNRYARKF